MMKEAPVLPSSPMSVSFSPNGESPINDLSAHYSRFPGSLTPIDRDFVGSLMADNRTHPYKQCRVLTIDDLSDDDLLEIFDFYVVRNQDLGYHRQLDGPGVEREREEVESWQLLVHVCRRWRCLVFGSTRRLNLQIYCSTLDSTAKRSLDVWPALPILIYGAGGVYAHSVDDVIALLGHSDRIRQIDLNYCTTGLIDRRWIANLFTAMEVPFPELATLHLSLGNFKLYGPVLPDSFLGGSAPRLRSLALRSIPFPGLPQLLLSTTHLVQLHLHDIPESGYISPEAMATCLSLLTSLESFRLEFEYPLLYTKSRRPFPPTRSVLPTLTNFWFNGPNKYLQDFVARIDAPQLSSITLSSTTFYDDMDFSTPEINRFISRTPTFGAYDEARLICYGYSALIMLRQSHPGPSDLGMVQVGIFGEHPDPDRHLSILAKICTLSLRLLLTMENLYINVNQYSPLAWRDDIENTEWFDLLLPFTAVKNLYVSKQVSPRIALALQKLTGGRTTELLPALQNIFLEGFHPSEPVHEGIAQFISARQLINHPVAISAWDRSLEDEDDD